MIWKQKFQTGKFKQKQQYTQAKTGLGQLDLLVIQPELIMGYNYETEKAKSSRKMGK